MLLIAALVTGVAAADTKVVKSIHQDGLAVMGQSQPAKDEQHTLWIGDQRLLMDQGGASSLVRMDQQKMYLINHGSKTYMTIDLPVDMNKLLPPGMAEQMLQMLQFSAKVTPTDEVTAVGEWKARRYDLSLTSSMMQMKMQVWATEDVELDLEAFQAMQEQITMMQPGMAEVVAELRKIDGFQVKSEGVMTVMNSEVRTTERTLSIEQVDAPAGTYDLPAGYAEEDFDFMKLQQSRQ
jgi:hypothetical protein